MQHCNMPNVHAYQTKVVQSSIDPKPNWEIAEIPKNSNSVSKLSEKRKYTIQLLLPAVFGSSCSMILVMIVAGIIFPQTNLYLHTYLCGCEGLTNYLCFSICLAFDVLLGTMGFMIIQFILLSAFPVGLDIIRNLENLGSHTCNSLQDWRHSAKIYVELQLLMDLVNEVLINIVPLLQTVGVAITVALAIGFIRLDSSTDVVVQLFRIVSLALFSVIFGFNYSMYRNMEYSTIHSITYLAQSELDLVKLKTRTGRLRRRVRTVKRNSSHESFTRRAIFMRCGPFFGIYEGAAITFIDTVVTNILITFACSKSGNI
ncbi:unnamed protein product [Allacma fusca]|uniref:Uncharacterized protein n=1 Tax=Allacma fusca TaxID=39272 RepID=A0A8J2PVE6_9HEXA|nr:unnamed protein product [Allacma fusca]